METVLLTKYACGSNLLGTVPGGGPNGYCAFIASHIAATSVIVVYCPSGQAHLEPLFAGLLFLKMYNIMSASFDGVPTDGDGDSS